MRCVWVWVWFSLTQKSRDISLSLSLLHYYRFVEDTYLCQYRHIFVPFSEHDDLSNHSDTLSKSLQLNHGFPPEGKIQSTKCAGKNIEILLLLCHQICMFLALLRLWMFVCSVLLLFLLSISICIAKFEKRTLRIRFEA